MSKRKTSVRNKILMVMLFLTVITFALSGIITLNSINILGKFTLKSCNELGSQALNNNKTALLEHSYEELLSLVIGQAMIANIQLEHIEDEMAMMVNLSRRYLASDAKYKDVGNEKRFLSFQEPDPIYSKSRIIIYNKDSGRKYEENMNSMGKIHPLLKFIYGNQNNIDLAYVCTSDGYYISYPWTKPRKGFLPFKRDWYQEAVKAGGREVWVGPYISANKNKAILTCARAVMDSKGKVLAVCGLDVTVKEITNSFIGMTLVHSGRAFLIDRQANVLARRKMKNRGMHWYDDYNKENLLESRNPGLRELAAKMIAGEEGIAKLDLPGEPEIYVAYASVPVTGWSIGVAVESDILTASAFRTETAMKDNIQKYSSEIENYFNKNLAIYLGIGFAVLVIVIITSFVFSHRITAPILILKKKALKIMEGNFSSDIHLSTGDELEEIDKTFDRMTNEIVQYMEHVKKTVRVREKIEQEFSVAGNIQAFMLPSGFEETPEVSVNAYLKPANEVSGDFYNYAMVDESHLFFCIGKVSGKGVPAAMLMSQVMTLLSHLGTMNISPDEILLTVNNTLVINNQTDMSVTAFCACLDIKTGELVLSNAEHVPAVFIHNKVINSLSIEKNPAMGINSVTKDAFKYDKLQLSPGDILLFTTNGIILEENDRGEVFSEKYLLNSFKDYETQESPMKFALSRIEEFYGSGISKIDVALLGIEYRGTGQ